MLTHIYSREDVPQARGQTQLQVLLPLINIHVRARGRTRTSPLGNVSVE